MRILIKAKRISFSSLTTSKKYFHFSSSDGCSPAQHSRQSSTGLQLHPSIQPPTNAHTYTQTHLEHVCAPGARDLEVAGLHFCSAVVTSATCFTTSCAEVPYRNLHAPGLSRCFLNHVAFSPASSGSAGSCTPQSSYHPAASPSSQNLPLPSCS